MAAAEAIFLSTAPAHSDLSIRVAQTTAQAALDSEEAAVSAKKRKSGPMLVSSVASQPKASGKETNDYMQLLAAYMQAVLALTVQDAQNQGKISQIQTDQSSAFVELSKKQLDDLANAIQAQQAAQEAEAHKSWVQRVISAVVASVLTVIGVLTFQPELAIAGLLMLTMTSIPVNSNGDTAIGWINSHLSSKLGLKILEEIGIFVGMAIVMAGVGGGISALMEGTSEGAVAGGAGEAAAVGGEDAAAAAGEEAAAEDGAAAQGSQTSSFASAALKAAWSKLRSQLAQMLFIENPTIDISKAAGAGDSTAEWIGIGFAFTANIASGIRGLSNSYKAAVAAGKLAEGASLLNLKNLRTVLLFEEEVNPSTTFKKLMNALGKTRSVVDKMVTFLKVSALALNVTSGVFGFQAGQQRLKQAGIIRNMADIQSGMVVSKGLLAMMTGSVQDTQATASALNQNLAMMNSRWDAYVAPYQTAVEVMG